MSTDALLALARARAIVADDEPTSPDANVVVVGGQASNANVGSVGGGVDSDERRALLLDALFSTLVEPTLLQPTFVVDLPIVLSPLARRCVCVYIRRRRNTFI